MRLPEDGAGRGWQASSFLWVWDPSPQSGNSKGSSDGGGGIEWLELEVEVVEHRALHGSVPL